MTAPTIGQIVFYTPGANEPIATDDAGGLPAMIVSGKNGGPFNLAVFDSNGDHHHRINVTMLDSAPPAKDKDAKEGEADEPWPPVMGPYCMAERKDITVPEPVPPELTSISPDKTVCGSPEFEMECAGKGFTPASVINMGGVPVITKYYGPEMLTTIVKPASAAPGETEVKIVDLELESGTLVLTFDPAPEVEQPPPEIIDSVPGPKPDVHPPAPQTGRRDDMGGQGGLAADAEVVRPKTKR